MDITPRVVTHRIFPFWARLLAGFALLLPACAPIATPAAAPTILPELPTATPTQAITPLPTRAPFLPGELVDYTVQTGDTLPALAAHFNTTEAEIRQANPIIPDRVTTLPPGMPMQIPIYYLPLWGTPYQIIPDELFINGPAQVGFNTADYLASQPGWLKDYVEYASGANRSAGNIIDLVATNYSVSPRLLVALLEYQAGGVTQPAPPEGAAPFYLGRRHYANRGLYLQLGWAANLMNNGYYAWRDGTLLSYEHMDGHLVRPDPWQNAATVALQWYFSRLFDEDELAYALSGEGLAKTYTNLFGEQWGTTQAHIPGSLEQPALRLPFEPGTVWAFTGGPHTGWGDGVPLAALDFAPPSVVGGCTDTDEWATAIADGVIARAEPGLALLDLDGDGDERTGWVIFYLHLAERDGIQTGAVVQTGDFLGHPSCEKGRSTGTHVHVARKYNGEWIPAGGVLAFDLEGWVAQTTITPYQGTLVRYERQVNASQSSSSASMIASNVGQ